MWGSAEEQHAFGKIWPSWNGDQGERNRQRAVEKLRLLADQGYAPAQYGLGWAYFDEDGARRDYGKAFDCFLAAAEQGYPGAEGMVGNFYISARPAYNVCEYNPQEAARWHRRAAEHGNAGSQYNYAFSGWTGRGVLQHAAAAFAWASLSVHCSPIRSRMAEVLRDQAAAELTPQQSSAAAGWVAEWSRTLPLPWSEHARYWRLLAEGAGAIKNEGGG